MNRARPVNAGVFAPLPRAAVAVVSAGGDEGAAPPRFTIHLPMTARDLPAALNIACALARSLDFLPQIDIGETTVSEEDSQSVRHRVFCDLMLVGSRRCAGRADHDGPCTPDQAGR